MRSGFSADEITIQRHGAAMYRRGCRCQMCKAGHATRIRSQRAKRGKVYRPPARSVVRQAWLPETPATESEDQAIETLENGQFGGYKFGQLMRWCENNRGNPATFTSDTGDGADVVMLENFLDAWLTEFPDSGLRWEVSADRLSVEFGFASIV
jgi:hypothetical protein